MTIPSTPSPVFGSSSTYVLNSSPPCPFPKLHHLQSQTPKSTSNSSNLNTPTPPTPTHTIPGELHQVQAYIEATNTRIQYLEELLCGPSLEQVTDIKRGLKDAHRGLEKLQKLLPVDDGMLEGIQGVTKETWQIYRRVVALEGKLREERKSESTRLAKNWNMQDQRRTSSMSDIAQLTPSTISFQKSEMATDRISEARSVSRSVSTASTRFRVSFPDPVPRTKAQVAAMVMKEQEATRAALYDEDRQRQGSADGFCITAAVMSGVHNEKVVIPALRFLKIHEVKELKRWLSRNGPGVKFLSQTNKSNRQISRVERLLHLLFVLETGLRLESIAVVFSRSPKQVRECCTEAFEGLLEMHSETVLPPREQQPLYKHLWDICRNFDTLEHRELAQKHYGWSQDDLYKVLATLNAFIGRYRGQGKLALQGRSLDWGLQIRTHSGSSKDREVGHERDTEKGKQWES